VKSKHQIVYVGFTDGAPCFYSNNEDHRVTEVYLNKSHALKAFEDVRPMRLINARTPKRKGAR